MSILRGLLVAALLPAATGWCCRSCGKCFCMSYGVCPRPSESLPMLKPIETWSSSELVDFINAISPGGARQSCPENCSVLSIIHSSRFRELNGADIHHILTEHERNLAMDRAHANASLALPLLLDRLVPAKYLPKLGMAFITRLKFAVEHATTLPPPPKNSSRI